MAAHTCTLTAAVGAAEPCPEASCPFWEAGGAVVEAGCGLERTGLAHSATAEPQLAGWLLELRARLLAAETDADVYEAHAAYRDLLPPGLHD